MFTIIFRRNGQPEVKLPAAPGESILGVAQRAGVSLDAPCSGNGTCGKCRVRVISGAVEMTPSVRLSAEDFADGWRLACQSRVLGDCTLLVPDEASSFRNDIRTADLGSPEELARYMSQIEALRAAFPEDSAASRPDGGRPYGIAADIGTTTVTAALLRLSDGAVLAKASLGNAQIRYGADVINRIIVSSRPGGREKLLHAVREETLLPIVDRLLASAGVRADEIARLVIAGNTTMEHLLVGANAESIRLEPFIPEFLSYPPCPAAALGLLPEAAGDAPLLLAPNVGSYVGGDITAGVLASRLWDMDGETLFIDLGTNGELVFGSRDYMLTCACSAGPAFEGGDISCGMRATTGAIDSVTLDPESLRPTLSVLGGGAPLGLCGSGLISLVSELFRCGVISAKGRFIRDSERVRRDEFGGAAFLLADADESANGRPLTLDESDLDNFIRAKAAIFSAVRTMLQSLDMRVDDIDRIILAGGIGSGIDIEKAISIGMLPKAPLEKYSYIGNSSLTGACAALLSPCAEDKLAEIGSSMTYLELSSEPRYMDEFIAACFLPHTDASLFEEVSPCP